MSNKENRGGKNMSYMTSAEWCGFERGLQKGESIMLLSLLETKFETVPNEYQTLIQQADENN